VGYGDCSFFRPVFCVGVMETDPAAALYFECGLWRLILLPPCFLSGVMETDPPPPTPQHDILVLILKLG
jgi:hypothetical protein